MKVFRYLLFLGLCIVIFIGVTYTPTAERQDIKWQNYLPNQSMVKYFSGGFENEGFEEIIHVIDEGQIEILSISAGMSSAQRITFKGSKPYIQRVELDQPIENWYQEKKGHYQLNELPQPLFKDTFAVEYMSDEELVIAFYDDASKDVRKEHYVKGLGLVKYERFYLEDTLPYYEESMISYSLELPESIGRDSRAKRFPYERAVDLATLNGYSLAQMIEDRYFTSDWLFYDLDKNNAMVVRLALNDVVLSSRIVDYPENWREKTVSTVGSGYMNQGRGALMTVTDEKTFLYYFNGWDWLLIDDFELPYMSQSYLPVDVEQSIQIVDHKIIYQHEGKEIQFNVLKGYRE